MRKMRKFLFILFIVINSLILSNCGYVLVALGLTPTDDNLADLQNLDALLYLLLTGSDTTAPTPGSKGTILLEDVSGTLKLTWAQASDDTTTSEKLQYKVVYSTSNNLETVDDAEANGTTAQDWTSDWTWEAYKSTSLQVTTFTPTDLSSGTQYYFNILVRDEAENKAVYTANGDSTVYAYSITTIAGDGNGSYGGDGGAATSAQINAPYGIHVDSSSNVYIADTFNHCIRKVDSSGNISTVAGTPQSNGSSGDSAAATSAKLYLPRGVYVDGSSNMFIADTFNNKIRKVDSGGTITTFAGTGTPAYSGDSGAANAAELKYPYDAYGDGTNIFIVDKSNDVIRKVAGTSSTDTITTVAGIQANGGAYSGDGGAATAADINAPFSITIDSSNNIYIADTSNHRIRKFTDGGNISTVAGNGSNGFSGDKSDATSAELNQPYGVAVDSSGNIYITDTYNDRIRRVDASTGIIYTIAGNGDTGFSDDSELDATSVSLYRPRGIYVDSSGNVYFSDSQNHRVRKLEPAN